MDRIPFMRRWDEAVLLRFPLLWQLRLHIYLPLALLCLLLAWWVGAAWLADPAHVLKGTEPTVKTVTIIMVIAVFALALPWLLGCRRYNGWRAHYPMGWWAWGAEFLGVWLLGMCLAMMMYMPDLGYARKNAAHLGEFGEVEIEHMQRAMKKIWLLDFFIVPENRDYARYWVDALQDPEMNSQIDEDALSKIVLLALERQDEDGIARMLQDYDRTVSPWGFANAGAADWPALARKVIQAYQQPDDGVSKRWGEGYEKYLIQRVQKSGSGESEGEQTADDLDHYNKMIRDDFNSLEDIRITWKVADRAWRPDESLQWRRGAFSVSMDSQYSWLEKVRYVDIGRTVDGFLSPIAVLGMAFAILAVLLRALSVREIAFSIATLLMSWGLLILLVVLRFLETDFRGFLVLGLFTAAFPLRVWFARRQGRGVGAVFLTLTVVNAPIFFVWVSDELLWRKLEGYGVPPDSTRRLVWTLMACAITVMLYIAISPLVRRWQGMPHGRGGRLHGSGRSDGVAQKPTRHPLRRWDEAVLLRFPLLWQLRLHIYLPLALLCLVMAWWAGSAWLADPVHVLKGTEPTVGTVTIIMTIAALALALFWLLGCRRYNGWRARYPMGRWAWGAEFLGVWLLGMCLMMMMSMSDLGYTRRNEIGYSMAEAERMQKAVQQLWLLDFFIAPENSDYVRYWVGALQDPEMDSQIDGGALSKIVLLALERQDENGIARMLQDYDQTVSSHGFTNAGAADWHVLARKLIQAYRQPDSGASGRWEGWYGKHLTQEVQKFVSGKNDAERSADELESGKKRIIDNFNTLEEIRVWETDGAWRPDERLQWHRGAFSVSMGSQYDHLESIKNTWGFVILFSNILAKALVFAVAFAILAVLLRALSAGEIALSIAALLMSWGLMMFLDLFTMPWLWHLNYRGFLIHGLLTAAFPVGIWLVRRHERSVGGVLLALTVANAIIFSPRATNELMLYLGRREVLPDIYPYWMLIACAIIAMPYIIISPLVRRWQGLPRRT